MNTKICAFAPATIGNISCGFDVLGLALKGLGDIVEVMFADHGDIKITKILGDSSLSVDTNLNVCGVVANKMMNQTGRNNGIDIRINKGIKAGSGLGSSSASSVATACAVNILLGKPFKTRELLEFSVEGEQVASGSRHADNISPCLLGGITLVRNHDTLDVISLPVPVDLYAVVLTPDFVINTRDARQMLSPEIALSTAKQQWANLAAFVAGIYRSDYELMSRSMEDLIAEPVRSRLIPGFDDLRQAALKMDAIGFGISGSGPAVFALTKGKKTALEVKNALGEAYTGTGMAYSAFISPVNNTGAHEVKTFDF